MLKVVLTKNVSSLCLLIMQGEEIGSVLLMNLKARIQSFKLFKGSDVNSTTQINYTVNVINFLRSPPIPKFEIKVPCQAMPQ